MATEIDGIRRWGAQKHFTLRDLLYHVIRQLASLGASPAFTAGDSSPAELTLTSTVFSNTTGTVAAGARAITFENTGGVDGTVDGATIEAGAVVALPAIGEHLYEAIAWDATGTDFTIREVR